MRLGNVWQSTKVCAVLTVWRDSFLENYKFMIHRFIKFLGISSGKDERKFMAIKKSPEVKTKKTVRPLAAGKKEVKKVVSKIALVKKVSTASKKKKPLVAVSGEACFWVNNGPTLRSMQDLREALLTMTKEQFVHHTGIGRNDFSAWVGAVLGDKKCSADILKAKNTKEALLAVEKHLKAYSV